MGMLTEVFPCQDDRLFKAASVMSQKMADLVLASMAEPVFLEVLSVVLASTGPNHVS